VCAAVDVHYMSTGGTRAAAVLAADAAFVHMLAERTAVVPRVLPCRPGQFYLRELPPIRAVLDDLSGLGLLVIGGYADLDPAGRPGLGAHPHAEFGIPVIGVAKSRFRTATRRAGPARILGPPAVRHRSRGCPQPTQRTWSGAWPAGTRCPTPCAAPAPSRGPVHPQPP